MGTYNHCTLLRYQPIQSERNNYWINGVDKRWQLARQLPTRNGSGGSIHSPFIFPHPFWLIVVFSFYHSGSTRRHMQCKDVAQTVQLLHDDTSSPGGFLCRGDGPVHQGRQWDSAVGGALFQLWVSAAASRKVSRLIKMSPTLSI